jgi:hypothetical protein
VCVVDHTSADDGRKEPRYLPGISASEYVAKGMYWQPFIGGSTWYRLHGKIATAVTNIAYETNLNEAKRNIKLIKQSYLPTFITLYENKLKESNV